MLLFLLLFSGCTGFPSLRLNANINIEDNSLTSRDETTLKLNLDYNDLGLKNDESQEYRISLGVNGNNIDILKNGNTISKSNAELVKFSKGNNSRTLEYTLRTSYVSGEYVESITVFISTTNGGVIKTITSDFITIGN